MYDLENICYLHATLDPDGIISEIGGKVLAESDLRPEHLSGLKFAELDFWRGDDHTHLQISNSVTLAGDGKQLEIEASVRESAAKTSTIKATFTPVFDDSKRVVKIIFSSMDVSEYIKEVAYYKARSERFLYAAESAEVGLWFWDLIKDVLFTTPRTNELYGFRPNDIMTFQKFTKTVHPDDLPMVRDGLNESHTKLTNYNIEYRVITPEKKIRWVSVIGKTFREDENTRVMMGSVRDITHRKLSDERLQQLLAAEKAARDEVEEANREKDHFLAVISHELRSPLNSILGWSKILLTKEVEKDTQRNALQTIENSAKIQAKLISDLVDSAKIISGQREFTFVRLSFNALINSAYQSLKPLADEKRIKFVLGKLDETKVTGDTTRLQQVVTNLATNAIKFTPPGGEIVMSLEKTDESAIFSITDTGTGIPVEELPHIFKQYFQSKSIQNKSGLGLGLSIVKAIVEKHGGRVSVKNNDNGIGCTFFVNLPSFEKRAVPKTEFPPTPIDPSKPLENVLILVVEDNNDSREVLHYYLNQMGAKVHSVNSASDGFAFLTSTNLLPHIIISDISMPGEDGYSFIENVRKLPREKGGMIPAIALTALVSNRAISKTEQAGFQRHHAKPFDADILVANILEILDKR